MPEEASNTEAQGGLAGGLQGLWNNIRCVCNKQQAPLPHTLNQSEGERPHAGSHPSIGFRSRLQFCAGKAFQAPELSGACLVRTLHVKADMDTGLRRGGRENTAEAEPSQRPAAPQPPSNPASRAASAATLGAPPQDPSVRPRAESMQLQAAFLPKSSFMSSCHSLLGAKKGECCTACD